MEMFCTKCGFVPSIEKERDRHWECMLSRGACSRGYSWQELSSCCLSWMGPRPLGWQSNTLTHFRCLLCYSATATASNSKILVTTQKLECNSKHLFLVHIIWDLWFSWELSQAGLASWMCDLDGHVGPYAKKSPNFDWMFCCHSLKILNFWKRALDSHFSTGPMHYVASSAARFYLSSHLELRLKE